MKVDFKNIISSCIGKECDIAFFTGNEGAPRISAMRLHKLLSNLSSFELPYQSHLQDFLGKVCCSEAFGGAHRFILCRVLICFARELFKNVSRTLAQGRDAESISHNLIVRKPHYARLFTYRELKAQGLSDVVIFRKIATEELSYILGDQLPTARALQSYVARLRKWKHDKKEMIAGVQPIIRYESSVPYEVRQDCSDFDDDFKFFLQDYINYISGAHLITIDRYFRFAFQQLQMSTGDRSVKEERYLCRLAILCILRARELQECTRSLRKKLDTLGELKTLLAPRRSQIALEKSKRKADDPGYYDSNQRLLEDAKKARLRVRKMAMQHPSGGIRHWSEVWDLFKEIDDSVPVKGEFILKEIFAECRKHSLVPINKKRRLYLKRYFDRWVAFGIFDLLHRLLDKDSWSGRITKV